MTKRKGLMSNPLLSGQEPAFDPEKERQALGITLPERSTGRPRKEGLNRERGSKNGLPEDWTRYTIIMREQYLEEMKNYAYNKRISIREAFDWAIEYFLEDQAGEFEERLEPEKPTKGGKK